MDKYKLLTLILSPNRETGIQILNRQLTRLDIVTIPIMQEIARLEADENYELIILMEIYSHKMFKQPLSLSIFKKKASILQISN